MNKFFLSLTAILFLSACSGGGDHNDMAEPPLLGTSIGGEFTLVDQDGNTRRYSEFDGQYRMVYFGYTSCPDICTPDMQNLMAGLREFEKSNPELGAKVQPMFITVDPGRDTPAVLKQFVTAFHPRLIGLTGGQEQIDNAAKKFAIYHSRVEGSTPENYLMAHSQTPFLMGADGKPLAIMPVDDGRTDENEGSPRAVADELSKWVH